MSQTMAEAAALLSRAAETVPRDAHEAMVRGAARVATEARLAFPRDTGEGAEGFVAEDAAVVNYVPHVPFVHDGVVDELLPELIEADEAAVRAELDRLLDVLEG